MGVDDPGDGHPAAGDLLGHQRVGQQRGLAETARPTEPVEGITTRIAVLQEVLGDADEFGIKVGEPEIYFPAVMKCRGEVAATLTGGVGSLLKKHGVDYYEGLGSLTASGTVAVGDQELEASKAIVSRRLGQAADPGHRVRRPRDRHRGGLGARGLPAKWPSSARRVRHPDRQRLLRLGVTIQLFEALDRLLPVEDADVSKSPRAVQEAGHRRTHEDVVTDVARATAASSFKYGDAEGEADWLVIAAGHGPTSRASGSTSPASRRRGRADHGRRSDAHERGRRSTRSATSSTARLAHKAARRA